jgi:serine/threonine protein kinase
LSVEEEPCPYQVLAPMSEDKDGVTYLAQALSGTRGLAALALYGPRDDVEAVLARYSQWKPVLDRVQHPGVARLLDVGLTAEGRLYVASEYIPGWPLTSLSRHASVGRDARAELARQLTSALAAAHAGGVVHLQLDAERVKVSTANGLKATILGLGSSLIVAGADGPPEVDRLALAAIVRELGVEAP